jgi:myo-inositol catabolism protein IolS
MKFRKLGNTDLKLSVIGIGTYQFGGSWGKTFNEKDVYEIFKTADDCGINYLDTAECYGVDQHSEKLIGKAIEGSRDKWIISTKFGHKRIDTLTNSDAWSINEIKQQLEQSLRNLKTDYIDIYKFHSGSNEIFDNQELWTMLDKQKREGKIRYLGISMSRKKKEWREHQIQNAKNVGADVIQVKYNRLESEAEKDVLDVCLKDNIGVIARVALASGLLSGKYQNIKEFSSLESRAKKYNAEKINEMQKIIDNIIANELPADTTLSQYALYWVLKHTAVSSVIPGCKSPEQVRQNAATADLEIMNYHHPLDL